MMLFDAFGNMIVFKPQWLEEFFAMSPEELAAASEELAGIVPEITPEVTGVGEAGIETGLGVGEAGLGGLEYFAAYGPPEAGINVLGDITGGLGEAGIPEITGAGGIPEIPVPEIPVPEIPVPEIPVPEIPVPEIPVPEIPVPEIPVPEIPVPEVPVPEVPVPEGFGAAGEIPISEASNLGAATGDVSNTLAEDMTNAGVELRGEITNLAEEGGGSFLGDVTSKFIGAGQWGAEVLATPIVKWGLIGGAALYGLTLVAGGLGTFNKDTGTFVSGTATVVDLCQAAVQAEKLDSSYLAPCQECVKTLGLTGKTTLTADEQASFKKCMSAKAPGGGGGGAAVVDACQAAIDGGKLDSSLLTACRACETQYGLAGVDASKVTEAQGTLIGICLSQKPTPKQTAADDAAAVKDAAAKAKAAGPSATGTVTDACQATYQSGKMTSDHLQLCLECEQTLGLAGKDASSLSATEVSSIGTCLTQKESAAPAPTPATVTDVCQATYKNGQITSDHLQLCLQCEQTLGLAGKDEKSLSATDISNIGACLTQHGGTAAEAAATASEAAAAKAAQPSGAAVTDACQSVYKNGQITSEQLQICLQCEQTLGLAGKDQKSLSTTDVSNIGTCLQGGKVAGKAAAAPTGVMATLQKYAIPIVAGVIVTGVVVVGTHGKYWGKPGTKKPVVAKTTKKR